MIDVSPDRVTLIEPGFEYDPKQKRSVDRKSSARLALAEAHPILQIGATDPLIVSSAGLHGDSGWFELIDSWPTILKHYPKARLWILGDGTKGRLVWDRIKQARLADSIIMPGSFDDPETVLQAADLYIHPLCEQIGCGHLIRALGSGVCTIATTANQNLIEHKTTGLLVSAVTAEEISRTVLDALQENDWRERLGAAAASAVSQRFNMRRLAGQYVQLCQ